MSTYRIPLAATFNGKDEFTVAGSAVLHGISTADLFDITGGDPTNVGNQPVEVRQLGRRRLREAQARIGSDNPALAIHYWAHQQWGDRVTIVYDTDPAKMWLTTQDPDIARWLAGDDIGRWA